MMAVIAVLFIPFIYLALIYGQLPETVPTHFNLEGVADGYSNKKTLIYLTFFLSVVSVGTFLLIKNLHKIDPKKAAGQSPELLTKISCSMLIFMCAIMLIIIHSSEAGSLNGAHLIFAAIGLMLGVLGNLMHSIKPNYFIGFRLPWTLESEENWRKTHQLVSKIWVAGGSLITIITLLLDDSLAIKISLFIIVLLVVIPVYYSFNLYQKNNKPK